MSTGNYPILAAAREPAARGMLCVRRGRGGSPIRWEHLARPGVWRKRDDGTMLLSEGRRIVHWIVTYDRVF